MHHPVVYSKCFTLSIDECKVHENKLKGLRSESDDLNDIIELSVVKES